jgi:uroporphyrinogen-III synthase
MRVLITRPEPDNQRSAAALEALGHVPLLARLTQIRPCNPVFRTGSFEALVATSAHALTCLPPEWRSALINAAPIYVVGDRTALAASEAGFEDVRTGPGDATGLVALLLEQLKPRSHVLYLAGEPRKAGLEQLLAEANHAVETVIVYRAEPYAVPPVALIDALDGMPLAVLHFSRASAESFATLASRANRTSQARVAWHFCLSADVAAGLAGLQTDVVVVAAKPNEATLLEALQFHIAQNSP